MKRQLALILSVLLAQPLSAQLGYYYIRRTMKLLLGDIEARGVSSWTDEGQTPVSMELLSISEGYNPSFPDHMEEFQSDFAASDLDDGQGNALQDRNVLYVSFFGVGYSFRGYFGTVFEDKMEQLVGTSLNKFELKDGEDLLSTHADTVFKFGTDVFCKNTKARGSASGYQDEEFKNRNFEINQDYVDSIERYGIRAQFDKEFLTDTGLSLKQIETKIQVKRVLSFSQESVEFQDLQDYHRKELLLSGSTSSLLNSVKGEYAQYEHFTEDKKKRDWESLLPGIQVSEENGGDDGSRIVKVKKFRAMV